MSPVPGTRLGTYKILSLLGTSGMGEVYRARDTRLGRDVAIKVLPEAVASHPDRLARFGREVKTVAALNHPNIVTLFSIDDESGVRFLTMELVEGESLDRLVTQGGLPLARHVLNRGYRAGPIQSCHADRRRRFGWASRPASREEFGKCGARIEFVPGSLTGGLIASR